MSGSDLVGGTHADRLLAVLHEAPEAGQRQRVLVIDSDASGAEILQLHVGGANTEVHSATTVERARAEVAAAPMDLILCNPDVAVDGALEFFGQVADYCATAGTVLVALVPEHGRVGEAALYAAGADAALAHPAESRTLVALVRTTLRRIGRDRRRMLEDPVTGQANLRMFREVFERTASLAARQREPLTVLVLHFGMLRGLRRERGITAADGVLRSVTRAVSEALRTSDLLARGTGDSLLALLPNTDEAGAQRVIEKVNDRLQRLATTEGLEDVPALALSAGLGVARPGLAFEAVFDEALATLQPVWSSLERAFAAEPTSALKNRPRILIAEDDALTASIIRHRLERLGHEVLHVPDGDALLRLAPETEPSLLILDVKMPYVDGFEALRRLRSMRSLRTLPVVMVTSMGNEEDVARGFELGADDYVVKPFSPLELEARVQRLLRSRG